MNAMYMDLAPVTKVLFVNQAIPNIDLNILTVMTSRRMNFVTFSKIEPRKGFGP